MEYKILDPEDYNSYKNRSDEITEKVSEYFTISQEDTTYKEIIQYFERNYRINFHFITCDFYKDFPDLVEETGILRKVTSPFIKHTDLFENPTIAFADDILLENCAGMTIPLENNRYFVTINQDANLGRVIFTTLHELSHIYCHLEKSDIKRMFVSIPRENDSNSYPDEYIPFEDEANTIASTLYLNTRRLAVALKRGVKFSKLAESNDMSNAALHNRILNYLMFEKGYPEKQALNYLCRYRYDGKSLAQIA